MAKTRLCQKCKTEIPAERIEAIPQTRLCATCSAEVAKKYGQEIRPNIQEKKLKKPDSFKTTGMDYDIELERNPDLPDRYDD